MGHTSELAFLNAFFLVFFNVAYAEPLSCPLATKNNTAFVSMTFNYSHLNDELDQKLRAIEKPPKRTYQGLKLEGTKSDHLFFNKLGLSADLDAKSLNDWDQRIVSKEAVIHYLKSQIGPDKSFVFFNYSGHGLHFPVVEDGKVVRFEWAMLLPVAGASTQTLDCMKRLLSFINKSKTGVPNAQSFAQNELLKTSQECERFVLTTSEINSIIGNRPTVGIIDACYAGEFAQNSQCTTNHIFALSSRPHEISSETLLISKLEDEFFKFFNARITNEVQQIKRLFAELNHSHPHPTFKAIAEENDFKKFYELAHDAEGQELIINALINQMDNAHKKKPIPDLQAKKRNLRHLVNRLIEHVSRGQEHVARLEQASSEEFSMGKLTNYLNNRNPFELDKNNDSTVSIGEYFSDLPLSFDLGQHPVLHRSQQCDVEFLNRPLMRLAAPRAIAIEKMDQHYP
jgi:ferritin